MIKTVSFRNGVNKPSNSLSDHFQPSANQHWRARIKTQHNPTWWSLKRLNSWDNITFLQQCHIRLFKVRVLLQNILNGLALTVFALLRLFLLYLIHALISLHFGTGTAVAWMNETAAESSTRLVMFLWKHAPFKLCPFIKKQTSRRGRNQSFIGEEVWRKSNVSSRLSTRRSLNCTWRWRCIIFPLINANWCIFKVNAIQSPFIRN